MKRYIKSAQLVNYNANSRGKHVGDCVKRSISTAFDGISYSEAGKLLNEMMKEKRATQWNIKRVFEPVIKNLGATGPIPMPEGKHDITVEEFADELAEPGKAYIILCGKAYPKTSHMVCIRDKKIFDSWNSKDQIVAHYFIVNSDEPLKEITDIKDQIKDICQKYASPIVRDEIEKYMYNKAWEGRWEFKATQTDYAMNYICSINIEKDVYITKDRKYSFRIVIPFEPTMTEQEAIEFARKTAKTRTYDRMYTVGQQEKKLIEEYKIRSQEGYDNDYLKDNWVTEQEKRFINSLPGWIRPLIKYLNIQNPGMYPDSYRLRIRPLPDDDIHDPHEKIVFEGYNANEIKEQIDYYRSTFQAPYIDYYPSEMF